jgi:hypothetical protein
MSDGLIQTEGSNKWLENNAHTHTHTHTQGTDKDQRSFVHQYKDNWENDRNILSSLIVCARVQVCV